MCSSCLCIIDQATKVGGVVAETCRTEGAGGGSDRVAEQSRTSALGSTESLRKPRLRDGTRRGAQCSFCCCFGIEIGIEIGILK